LNWRLAGGCSLPQALALVFLGEWGCSVPHW
jgi:hypothetical protein